jgi:glycosyltransferase involved in cell wall biosynthesis
VTRRLRVLVSAYACEPGRGSEPGVGWNQVAQIARFQDVWVITRANNKASIEREGGLPGNVHWTFFDLPRWLRFWKKGQRGVHLYYFLWQLLVYGVARRLHRRIRFDLAHHVTFASYWTPSLLCLLPVPFVWGPVGGADSTPKAFLRGFSLRGRIYERLRGAAIRLGERNPLVRLTARRARIALAMTRETAKRLTRLGCRDVRALGESALGEDEIRALSSFPYRDGAGFRLVSVGRLLHLKGYHLSLRAFARFRVRFPESTYWLIGGGPERRGLEALAQRLGVGEAVRFLGSVSRREALEKLAECDALVHPSLHDSGGWVCLESMAAGRPVICFGLGGPEMQVCDETGIKVPAVDGAQAIRDLADAMERLAADRRLRVRMGEAARKQVRECFSWNAKGERMRELYSLAMGEA